MSRALPAVIRQSLSMTEDVVPPDRRTLPFDGLADQHLALLQAVWQPCRDRQRWPVWDYVARTLYRSPQQVADAGRLIASLPTVARGMNWVATDVSGDPRDRPLALCRTRR